MLLGERARLSREVHDTLLQSLVGLALQFDALASDVEPSSATTKEQIVRMRKQVEEHIREARQSIQDLRSPTLERADLPTALRRAGSKRR
jgi:signal transduction histidine kinase